MDVIIDYRQVEGWRVNLEHYDCGSVVFYHLPYHRLEHTHVGWNKPSQ